MSKSVPNMTRRADIDWIRVAAFGLLILYHVGLYYAPWDWHVHSARSFEWLRYGALITNPWRLTLLFLVSGVALRFMSRRLSPLQVIRARAARLIPPFLFGVLVLVPPQSWIEAMDKFGWRQDFFAWWLAEFSPQGFADGIPLNHLWFVLYIGVYSLAAALLLVHPAVLRFAQKIFEVVLGGPRLLILPVAYLAFSRQSLFATYGLSNHLTTDWYNHAISFGVFLLGFTLALSDRTWADFERLRWPALITAALALPLLIALEANPGGMAFDGLVQNSMFALDQWATICAVLGFASRHIRNADGPLLRYLTDAVFPCYLAHQTILVVAAHLAAPLALPVNVEAPLLATTTLGGSLLVYELVRRIGPIRPLWGLKRLPRAPAKAAQTVEAAAAARPAKAA
ncbi:acyltransferase [Phenylobacterium aquaticum]|uniref:acyltransferase family protein n=1 Tax=Phenylobacterium aquaticum TaxID=1763816 RepID=UPI0026EF3E51|nr:acyltransferase [Phenylobacterium aquaticum]